MSLRRRPLGSQADDRLERFNKRRGHPTVVALAPLLAVALLLD